MGRFGSDQVQTNSLGNQTVKPLEEVVREARKIKETASEADQDRGGATNSQNQRRSRSAIPSPGAYLLTRLSHLNDADYGSLNDADYGSLNDPAQEVLETRSYWPTKTNWIQKATPLPP